MLTRNLHLLKPGPGTSLMAGHPLAPRYAFLLAEGGGMLTQPHRHPKAGAGSGVVWGLSPSGVAPNFSSTAYFEWPADSFNVGAGPFSIVFHAYVSSSGSGIFRTAGTVQGAGTPSFYWGIAEDNTINLTAPVDIRFGTALVPDAWYTVGIIMWPGSQVRFWARDRSMSFYLAQSNSTLHSPSNNNAVCRIGNYHGGGFGWRERIAWSYLYGRALADTELEELHQNPFGMFQGAQRLWLNTGAAAFNPAWAGGANRLLGGGIWGG